MSVDRPASHSCEGREKQTRAAAVAPDRFRYSKFKVTCSVQTPVEIESKVNSASDDIENRLPKRKIKRTLRESSLHHNGRVSIPDYRVADDSRDFADLLSDLLQTVLQDLEILPMGVSQLS